MNRQSQLWISNSAAEFVLHLSRTAHPRETGGVLAGYETDGVIVISHATEAGPGAEEESTTFRRDGTFTQLEIDRIFEGTSGGSDYMGEWHSHPMPVGPSRMDRHAMIHISGSDDFRTPEPLLLIVQRTRWRRWRLLPYRWSGGDLHPLSVSVLPSSHLPRR